MLRVVLALALAAIFTVTVETPISADDGINGRIPTIIPAKLTAEQLAANNKKIAEARQYRVDVAAGRRHLGDPWANWSAYKEPQTFYAQNWCGTGTSTILITGWKLRAYGSENVSQYTRYSNPDGAGYRWFTGGDAFMQHLAYDDDVVQDDRTGQPISEPPADPTNDPKHDYSDETHVMNAANAETVNERGPSFEYVVWQNMGTLDNFDTALYFDIANWAVPFASVVKPCPGGTTPCLEGWQNAPTTMLHWVTPVQFDVSTDALTYVDSASTAQAWGGDPWFTHAWPGRSAFFNTYMRPYMNGAIVW